MENKNMKEYMESQYGKEPFVVSEIEKMEVLEETEKAKKIVNELNVLDKDAFLKEFKENEQVGVLEEPNVYNVSNLYPCVMYASQKELDDNLKARINGVLLTNISFDEKLKNVMVLVENYRLDSLKLFGDKLVRGMEHREGE